MHTTFLLKVSFDIHTILYTTVKSQIRVAHHFTIKNLSRELRRLINNCGPQVSDAVVNGPALNGYGPLTSAVCGLNNIISV